MRKTFNLVAAGLVLATTVTSAQQPTVPATTGITDLGVRVTQAEGDAARYQRYEDQGDGAMVDRFRYNHQGSTWRFEGTADHVGRRDQRFTANFLGNTKVKAQFVWDQLPTYVSADARSPYSTPSPGVYRLDPAMRTAIESGRLTMADLAATSLTTDIRSYRHTAAFNFLYTPTHETGVSFNVRQTQRLGTLPWMAPFAFNNLEEIAAPVDTRTTDVDGGLEWSSPRAMARVGYAGSWFHNNVPTLVWDNPLRTYDSTSATAYVSGDGGSTGQAAMWPDSNQQGITATGSLTLPARTRISASLTTALLTQNQALLPVTANLAIPDTPLPRPTADVEARTLAMNYVVTSRPANALWLTARYRYYDFDNRTPVFLPHQFVVMDQTAHPGVPTSPLGYKRQNADVDASLTPMAFVAIRAGYSRADNEYPTRIYGRTAEDTYRASLDTAAVGVFTFRGIYEHSVRKGSEFDEALLIEAGEQPDMRHFDIANRKRDRVTGLVQVNPHKTFGLSASLATGQDRYEDSGFGLRDSDSLTYSFGADVTAGKHVTANAAYTIERYTALQNSRTANPNTPQVTDPTRNWALDTDDHADTIGAWLDLVKLVPRTDVHVGYDHVNSRSTYVYRVPASTTLPALLPLPAVRNEVESFFSDVRFYLTPKVAVAGSYWYDRYAIDDFATDQTMLDKLALPGALYVGSLFRPSMARTGALRLILIW